MVKRFGSTAYDARSPLSVTQPSVTRFLFQLGRHSACLLLVFFGSPAAAQDALRTSELATGVYVVTGVHEETTADNMGAIANAGFIVGSEAVAVIDTGGSARAGERLRQAVRAVTNLPIRYVINTHVHPDHIMGNAAFAPEAPIFVGHHNLSRAIAARGPHYLQRLRTELGPVADDTVLVPPELVVDDVKEIDLGDRILRLEAHRTAHTDNDLTIYDDQTSVLWTGDLLFVDRIPVLDGNLGGWLATITKLRKIETTHIIPGHGPPLADGTSAFNAQEDYLRLLQDEIRALISQGGSIEKAAETVGQSARGNWILFESYHARNVIAAYAEIEWE